MTFAARRQSVLASTATGRRASLIAGAGNVMGALSGGSEQDLMAAAVAAIDMEDTFEDAQVAVRAVTRHVTYCLALPLLPLRALPGPGPGPADTGHRS